MEDSIKELVAKYIKDNLTIEVKEESKRFDNPAYVEIILMLDGEKIDSDYFDLS